ncbi:SUKH-3 domain-containing protein [Rhodopirellula sp. MGV]|uniref:SUKH-3 domain-containing protein n=1 Tax=Rhodopirellula sp. MGV TaxID=2023130 RepID=UPI000B95ED95|nr:SUKH-3 domain-containing protein [Rhodopirellula sp. MGV]OYP36578.1 hypothetical protein CGZ80_08085 [Rhodopirellula sp. MGV]PNY34555.1 hypothetical protein C2E31_22900 [Rhodopirellula baltica]
MNLDISTLATHYFHLAGFKHDRSVPVASSVPFDHPAHDLLARFGGLHIGVGEDNEMLGGVRNDVAFEPTGRYGEIDQWERLLKTRLVGVAGTHHRHGLLYVSDDERFFNLSGMHDAMGFAGRGVRNAIDNLLFDESKPMIRPEQTSVAWYGIDYFHGDPALYDYTKSNS